MKKIILVFIIILLLLIPSIVLAQDDDLPRGASIKMGFLYTNIPISPLSGFEDLIGGLFNIGVSFGRIGIGIEYCCALNVYYSVNYSKILFVNHYIRATVDIFHFTILDILSSFQPFIGVNFFEAYQNISSASAMGMSAGYKHLFGKGIFFVYYGLVYTAIISHDGDILSGGFTESHLALEIGFIVDITFILPHTGI